jgi:hypothetical protein
MVQPLYAVKKRPSLLTTILLAGLVAGTIDALFAIADFTITTQKNPVIIFWYIATGVFGTASSPQTMATAGTSAQTLYAIAGVLFHYFIAYAFTALLIVIYPTLKGALKNKFIIAIVYGIFTWLVMSHIVVPLAITGKLPTYNVKMILAVSFLIIAIGLTGSLFAEKYWPQNPRKGA